MAIFQVTNTISTLEKLPLKNGYIYYIANLDNLSDIMSHGISAISTDPKRSHAEPIYGKAISEYVSLYFNPRNATLYSAQKSYGSKIIILQIHKTALLADGVIFTNASATAAKYECANELSDLLNTQFISWSEVMSKGWNHANKSIKQSKRDKMMAEALVPTHLPIDMIAGIICQDSFIAKSIASDYNITAVADMEYFFPIKLYAPQSKDELANLIDDEDIYLGDIDTSDITDMSNLFYESEREDFSGIENWDVSSVTNMSDMFAGCKNFNQPLNSWDVSSVTDMSYMFAGCYDFNQPLDSWLINNPNADKIINEIYGYDTFEKARATIKPINGKYHPKYKWQLKLLTLDNSLNLGDIDTSAITDMSELFYGSEREDFSGIESWDVGSVTDMGWMFVDCDNFNQPLNNWDVSSVVNMSEMFAHCYNFNQPLNNWDVSSVTDMNGVFADCKNFNQPLNNWDVSSVTNMRAMFADCKNFNQPLNNWDVSSVTDMIGMLADCENFNQPLDSWKDKLSQELIDKPPLIYFVERKIVNNKTRYYPKTKDELESLARVESLNLGDIDTSAIIDMSDLFYKIRREDFSGIENWDVSSVTDMSGMFYNCENFNQPLNNWNVSSVVNMSGMFAGCDNFNQPLNSWNVSSVTDMNYMFAGCKNFNQPLNNWDVNSVTDMRYMFSDCENFNQPLNNWDVDSVTDMRYMFSDCENFNQPLNNWNVSSVTNMSRMFYNCKNFNQPLGSWDVSSVVNMSEMFRDCANFNQPLDGWDVSSVTDMSYMFHGCKNFNQLLDNWNVSSVTNMSEMFYNCYNFNQPLDNWDVSSVTNMGSMFRGCENFNQPLDSWRDKLSQELINKLPLRCFVERKIVNNKTRYYPKTRNELRSLVRAESLNLGDIDTSAITDMSELFDWNKRKDFNGIDSWDVSSVTNMSRMFYNCENFNQPLDNWDVSSVTNMSEMFRGCEINDENKPKFTKMDEDD